MRAVGNAEWKKHQQGRRLTLKPAVQAKCFGHITMTVNSIAKCPSVHYIRGCRTKG